MVFILIHQWVLLHSHPRPTGLTRPQQEMLASFQQKDPFRVQLLSAPMEIYSLKYIFKEEWCIKQTSLLWIHFHWGGIFPAF